VRLANRVKKLEAAVPKCDGPVLRFVRKGEPYVPGDADRCRVCGGCHVLVVREVIVRTRADVERVRALNAAEGRS
jgi:hypothetical protein